MGPQVSRTRPRAASAEWKPRALRMIRRTLLLMPSWRPLLTFRSRAAVIPVRCLRRVLAALANGCHGAVLGLGAPGFEQGERVAGFEVAVEDRAQCFFEFVAGPERAAASAEASEHRGLVLVEVFRVLQKRPAGSLEQFGLVRIDLARMACHSVRRTSSKASVTSLTTWNGSMQITAFGAWSVTDLRNAAPMSMLAASILLCALGAEVVEEPVQGRGVLARPAPHDLPCGVVRDEREVLVVLAPGDLIDPDHDQPVEVVVVEFGGHDAFADPPDRVPVDPQEPRDRALVGAGGQERGGVLELGGKPRTVAGERRPLGDHPVLGTAQPTPLGPHHHHRGSEVQVPPTAGHRPLVVARPGRIVTQRTVQLPGRQLHLYQQQAGLERHAAHRDPGQIEQAIH